MQWDAEEEGVPAVTERLLGQLICEMLGAFLQGISQESESEVDTLNAPQSV
jgi:hypothetical protein